MRHFFIILFLCIILTVIGALCIPFTLLVWIACLDGLVGYYGRYKGDHIPEIFGDVEVVEVHGSFTFWRNPIVYVGLKLIKKQSVVFGKTIYTIDLQDYTELDNKRNLVRIRQIMETGYIMFYLLYAIELIYRFASTPKTALEKNCFVVDCEKGDVESYYEWAEWFLRPIKN